MPRIKPGGLLPVLLAVALLGAACGGNSPLQKGGEGSDPSAPQGTVIVGSTNFTEQLILAHMYAITLKDRGVKVEKRLNLGPREVAFPALKAGEISLLPEYTGNLLNYLAEDGAKVSKPDEVLTALRKELPAELVALEPAPAQDTDAYVVTQQTARKYDLQTLSDLEGVAGELVVGGPPELKERAVGLPGLKRVYGLEFKAFRPLDTGGPITKSALKQGDIDVALLFTTDPSIRKNNWVVLEDNKDLIHAQNIIPVIRKEALTPTIKKTLNKVSSQLTTEEISKLNGKVILDKKDPAKVARNWLIDQGLIGS